MTKTTLSAIATNNQQSVVKDADSEGEGDRQGSPRDVEKLERRQILGLDFSYAMVTLCCY